MSLCSVKISSCWSAEIGRFDQFPQLQELGLLLKFANLVAEGHHMVDVLKFLFEAALHSLGRAKDSA